MIKAAKIVLSMLIFFFVYLSLNVAHAFDHSKMTGICKAKIEQDHDSAGYKTVRYRMKGVKGQGSVREYRIKAYLTTDADLESVMVCKCKITSGGEILALEHGETLAL